jgi:hypothetical protein
LGAFTLLAKRLIWVIFSSPLKQLSFTLVTVVLECSLDVSTSCIHVERNVVTLSVWAVFPGVSAILHVLVVRVLSADHADTATILPVVHDVISKHFLKYKMGVTGLGREIVFLTEKFVNISNDGHCILL